MNEQLQQALAEILKKTIAGIDAGTSFLSSQLPDLIHQLLVWKIWESIISMGIGFLFLGVCVFFSRLAIKNFHEEIPKEWSERGEERYGYPGLAAILAGIICAFLLITNIYNCVQIIVAPKIYLIEYVSDLNKKK